MQRCELAAECCVCDVALCPYDYLDEMEEGDDEALLEPAYLLDDV